MGDINVSLLHMFFQVVANNGKDYFHSMSICLDKMSGKKIANHKRLKTFGCSLENNFLNFVVSKEELLHGFMTREYGMKIETYIICKILPVKT